MDFNRFYGSNNVTLLNGLLPHVLPEVYAKLHSLLLDSLKKSNWNERRKHFGIRSVYVLSANRDGLDEHLEKVRERRDAKEGRKSMFIVSPIDPEAENKVQKVREIEYQRLHSYIEERPGTLYSLVVQLTDETSAHGGHLAIKVAGNEVDDDVDGENIDESEIIDEEVAKSLHRPIEDIKLEKGNSFLIPGSALFGFEPVHYGEKSCIVVEFWQYKDSFFDPRRPSLRDGEMLGLVEDRKQKAEL